MQDVHHLIAQLRVSAACGHTRQLPRPPPHPVILSNVATLTPSLLALLCLLLPLPASPDSPIPVAPPAGFVQIAIPPHSDALVSIPFQPADPSLNAVLAGPDFRLEPGVGFILCNRQSFPQTVRLSGTVVVSPLQSIPIPAGAGLFSYPFSSAKDVNGTQWSKSFSIHPDTNAFQMGAGYWIVAPSNTYWHEPRPYPTPRSLPFCGTEPVRVPSARNVHTFRSRPVRPLALHPFWCDGPTPPSVPNTRFQCQQGAQQ